MFNAGRHYPTKDPELNSAPVTEPANAKTARKNLGIRPPHAYAAIFADRLPLREPRHEIQALPLTEPLRKSVGETVQPEYGDNIFTGGYGRFTPLMTQTFLKS
ncbi:hypothetical protein F4776DRAFT_668963 [Hypoxylon sp. NC0597]|nr:hypothetical protein F4776DRAFT_668963 [Hypoxylon sp. NC0597]